ncbi:MAG: OmpW family outer membrane protein [Melioribacteraceae bacterium]|nr:hypothetical protein [Melioribacteraceae bacterium]RJP62464.1 MAG: hypothetical protein C4543_01930 [Ignavibacteriales bacterium]WKZ69911.1 MAG: OmpW family outer membrane protein [Melioribacteraceae bacterium]
MRKVLFILIIFIAATTISLAQFYRVGSGFVISLPADNVKFGGGFEVFVEYKNESIFSFRTNGGFVITKFEDVNPYVSDIDYSLYWLDGSVILTPFKIIFEPYLGAGIGYYFFSTEEFNEVSTATGIYFPQKLSNKFSYHVKAGFTIPLNESIKLHLQGKYLLMDRTIIVNAEEIVNDEIRKSTIEEKFDLSNLFITAGIILKI